MKMIKTIATGALLVGGAVTTTTVSANTERYEGTYQMEAACETAVLSAGIGFAMLSPAVVEDGVEFDAIEESVVASISMSCENQILDAADVEAYRQEVSQVCQDLEIGDSDPVERAAFCEGLAIDAVESLQAASNYFMSEVIDTVQVSINNDGWLGGLGSMDYVFSDGRTEQRGPNVYVSNGGSFRRGSASEAETPNPLGCFNTHLMSMAGNMDVSDAFPGGARLRTTTDVLDGVVCPVPNPFGGDIVVGAYGYHIKLRQVGDRL